MHKLELRVGSQIMHGGVLWEIRELRMYPASGPGHTTTTPVAGHIVLLMDDPDEESKEKEPS